MRFAPCKNSVIDPLILIVVMSLAAGLISGLLPFVGSPVGMLAYGFAGIILVPVAATIGAFIGAGLVPPLPGGTDAKWSTPDLLTGFDFHVNLGSRQGQYQSRPGR